MSQNQFNYKIRKDNYCMSYKKKTFKDDDLLRNAFIRVSAVNHLTKDNDKLGKKAGDVVTYTLDDIVDTLKTWNSTKKFEFFVIQHETEDNVHYHIVIDFDFKSSCKFRTLKNKFPYGRIDNCYTGVKNCVRYLKHEDKPDKKQYEWEDIITNAPDKLEKYKDPNAPDPETEFLILKEKILTGQIKKFEIDKIPPEMFIKHSYTIDKAFEYYEKTMLANPNRNIEIFVFQGSPRVGKSTFCKVWAENNDKSICFSSSSRDPWQDYGGQDIFVYDDFDYNKIDIEDFKKALDPFTNTTNSRRYQNALFMGDTIIICTNTPIGDWFPFASDKSRKAVFKRINLVLDFMAYSELLPGSDISIIEPSVKKPEFVEGVSYYTVNNIILTDNFKNAYDKFGTVVNRYREIDLQSVDGILHEFDLKKYITFIDKTAKTTDFLKKLETI